MNGDDFNNLGINDVVQHRNGECWSVVGNYGGLGVFVGRELVMSDPLEWTLIEKVKRAREGKMSTAYLEKPAKDNRHRVTIKLVKVEGNAAELEITTNADKGELGYAANRIAVLRMQCSESEEFTVVIEEE